MKIEKTSYTLDGNTYGYFLLKDNATLLIKDSNFTIINNPVWITAENESKIVIINSKEETTASENGAIYGSSFTLIDKSSMIINNSYVDDQIFAIGNTKVSVTNSSLGKLALSGSSNTVVYNSKVYLEIGLMVGVNSGSKASAYFSNCEFDMLELISTLSNISNLRPSFLNHWLFSQNSSYYDFVLEVYNSKVDRCSFVFDNALSNSLFVFNCTLEELYVSGNYRLTLSNSNVDWLRAGHFSSSNLDIILTNSSYVNRVDPYGIVRVYMSDDSSLTKISLSGDPTTQEFSVVRDYSFYLKDNGKTALENVTDVRIFPKSDQNKPIALAYYGNGKFSSEFYFTAQNISGLLSQSYTIAFSFEKRVYMFDFFLKEPAMNLNFLSVSSSRGRVDGTGWYKQNSNISLWAPNVLEKNDNGTGYALSSYSIDDSQYLKSGLVLNATSTMLNIPITLNEPHKVFITYAPIYHLTVKSDFGTVSGDGWYYGETYVKVAVNPTSVGNFLVKKVFSGWIDERDGNNYSAYIKIDSAKTIVAKWRTDYLGTYILIALLISLIILVITFKVLHKRKK